MPGDPFNSDFREGLSYGCPKSSSFKHKKRTRKSLTGPSRSINFPDEGTSLSGASPSGDVLRREWDGESFCLEDVDWGISSTEVSGNMIDGGTERARLRICALVEYCRLDFEGIALSFEGVRERSWRA